MPCLKRNYVLGANAKGYAWEITTPEGGWGLHEVLKSRNHVLNGITNGIDMDEWDPECDEFTAAPFTANDLAGKAVCKAELQRELGFEVNHEVCGILFVDKDISVDP
jgi:starch synthase